MQNNSIYTMEELFPVISSFFDEDKKVIITAVGNSMRPLLRHKKDGIVLEKYKGQPLQTGDMAFYKRETGRYVLHRIVGIDENGSFTMLGDHQTEAEKGIREEQILALPTAIIRGKRTISLTSKGYQRYARFWSKSVFFRKLNIKLFLLKVKIFRIITGNKVTVG